MSLNYAVADVREPGGRNATYSKTIVIPGSKANNKLFSSIFEVGGSVLTSGTVNFVPDFNPNIKADAVIYVDNIQQLKGYAQLLNVVRHSVDHIEYEIAIFGRIGDFYQSLGTAKLEDLDLTEYNHTYNLQTQQNSWATSIRKNSADYPFTLGEGYVYPMIDYGKDSGNLWGVGDFFPAVYTKTYWDKIMEYAGFSYRLYPDSFRETIFKRLIHPFNSSEMRLTQAQIDLRKWDVALSSPSNGSAFAGYNPGVYNRIIYQNEITDPSNQYTTVTGLVTLANSGTYEIELDMNGYIYAATDVTFLGATDAFILVSIIQIDFSGARTVKASWQLSEVTPGQVNPWNIPTGTSLAGTIFTTTGGGTSITKKVSIPNLVAGHQLFVSVNCYFAVTSVFPTGTVGYSITASEFKGTCVSTVLATTDTVDMNSVIPENVLMRDYFTSVLRLFNLYVEHDDEVTGRLNIQTRQDFYTSGTTQDWTRKIDTKSVSHEPMGTLDFKRITYTYKEDSDFYNTIYKSKYGEVYGQKRIDVDNDFQTQEKKVEVLFSPTPLFQKKNSDRIISSILNIDARGNVSRKTANTRILYYGGVKNTAFPFQQIGNDGVTITSQSTYAYAGHLDNPTDPTLDLCFGVPREVYYKANVYTNGNLYTRYHEPSINELIHKDSKVLKAHFRLTPVDIMKLDFRDKIFIDGQNWRLNKIIDYNPSLEELTLCELIKINNSVTTAAVTSGTTNGGKAPIAPGLLDQLPGPGIARPHDGPGATTPESVVRGRYNYIDDAVSGVGVFGNDNFIGDNCQNILLLASSGVAVPAGTKNAIALMSSGISQLPSNMVLLKDVLIADINNIHINRTKIVTGAYYATADDEFLLGDASGGNVVVLLPQIASLKTTKEYTIKKIDSSTNDVFIIPYVPTETIDGQSFKLIETQWEVQIIQCNWSDKKWYIKSTT